tara:strand:+ start:370 stop:759 length:390 start_codon:yes stop_codon:yes gene_type:complete
MSNNTTAETCLNALNETIDCIPLETSSLFDDIEVILLAVAALLGIAAWARQKYLSMMADGKITLDEIIDSVGEAKVKAAEAEAEIEKIEKTLASHNVSELKVMLKEAGLSVKGKKADLVARLEAHMDGE